MVTLERSAGADDASAEPRTARCSPSSSCRAQPGNEREAMARVERGGGRARARAGAPRAPEDRGRRGHDERDGARQRVPAPTGPVSIRVLHAAGRLRVQVTDRGDAGELAEPEAPDLEAKLEGRQKPRGWGLFLIEKMVDEARVTSEGGERTARARAAPGRRRTMATSELQAAVRERDGVAVIDLTGDVNSSRRGRARRRLREATAAAPARSSSTSRARTTSTAPASP